MLDQIISLIMMSNVEILLSIELNIIFFLNQHIEDLEISVRNHQTRMAHESELISRNNYL